MLEESSPERMAATTAVPIVCRCRRSARFSARSSASVRKLDFLILPFRVDCSEFVTQFHFSMLFWRQSTLIFDEFTAIAVLLADFHNGGVRSVPRFKIVCVRPEKARKAYKN